MGLKIITSQEKKIVLKNFFSLSTLQGINYLLPVVVLPYLIRVIGPEKFGLIAFAQAFVQYFMILTDYGFSLSATKKISLCQQDKKNIAQIFSSVMTVKMALATVSFFILLAIIRFVPRFRHDWLVYILSFGAVVGNTLFPVWFYQGKEKMAYIATINIIGGVLYAASVFLLVRGPEDYLYVPFLNSLFFLITGVTGLYIAFNKFGVSFIFQTYEDIQKELKAGWSIFISIVAINTYTTTRTFAVGLLTNNVLTGYYSIAERIANVIQTFPLDSLSQALYPRINKIFKKDRRRAMKLMRRIQKSTMLSYLAMLPLVFWAAPLLVNIFCGKDYHQVVIIFRILLFPVFFIGSNAFRVQFLLVCARTDLYSKLHIGAALAGLPLIFFCIHEFSYFGAAFATTIIEAGVIISTFQLIRKYVLPPPDLH